MDDIKNQLIAKEHHPAEAEKNNDEALLGDLVSSGFKGVDPHGRRINRDFFIASYTSQDFTISSLEIDDLSVRIYDNIGILLGKSTFKGAFKDHHVEGKAKFMDVWHYHQRKWQLVASQVTLIEKLE